MTPKPKEERGERAAHLFWTEAGERTGLTWRQVGRRLGGQDKEKVRSAARDYRSKHPDRFGGLASSPSGVSITDKGNYRSVSSRSARIRTLDDLLEASNVDRKVWRVLKWGTKSWEGYAADVKKQLVWKEGRQTGTDTRDGLITTTLRSVWADLVRIEPIPIRPIIRPIESSVQFAFRALSSVKGSGRPMARALIGGDNQIGFRMQMPTGKLVPFHDRVAMDLFVMVAEQMQPDRISIIGDFLDMTLWTDKFLRSVEFEFTTQPAILEGHHHLRALREVCPNAVITVHEGNHDKRMEKHLTTHLRAACGLRPADEIALPPALSPERLLALHTLGIEWVADYPNDFLKLNEALRVRHGDVARKNGTCQTIANGNAVSEIVGHIHRIESGSKTLHDAGGEAIGVVTVHSPGCLCRIDGVVPGSSKEQQWQQGFAVVDYDPRGTDYSVTTAPIFNGRAVWDGMVLTGADTTELLKREYPDYNW